jgi:hypothetical protein
LWLVKLAFFTTDEQEYVAEAYILPAMQHRLQALSYISRDSL